jgi:hypothetical protein
MNGPSGRPAPAAAAGSADRTTNTGNSGADRIANAGSSGADRTANADNSGPDRTANAGNPGADRTANTGNSGADRTANADNSGRDRTANAGNLGAEQAASAGGLGAERMSRPGGADAVPGAASWQQGGSGSPDAGAVAGRMGNGRRPDATREVPPVGGGLGGVPGEGLAAGVELPILPLDGRVSADAGVAGPDEDGWQGRGPGAAAGRPMSLGDTLPIVSPKTRRVSPVPPNDAGTQQAPGAPAHAQATGEPTHAQAAAEEAAQGRTDRPAAAEGRGADLAAAQRASDEAARRRPQHLGDGAAEAVPGAPRVGAHAAPYMDARGVLHNLKPIGRLEVSGPDAAPRAGDSEFGQWFAGKEEEAASDAEGLPTRTRVRRGEDDAVAIDLDVTGLLAGAVADGQVSGRSDDQTPDGGPGDERTEKGSEPALPLLPGPEPVLAEEAPKAARTRRELTAADLEAIRWRLDGGTLREVVDDKEALRELGEKLDEPLADDADNVAKAGLLSVRAEVFRLLGELGMAAAASRLALAHAESARDTQTTVIAQAELAHVLRLRGDFGEADRLFVKAAAAAVPDSLRSVVHENAGRCCFDQGRYMEALDHFARAVRLGRTDDTELAERIGVCLEAVYIHVLRDGWGPYPRMDGLDEATAEQPTLR